MLTSLQCNRLKQTRGDFYPQIPLYSLKLLRDEFWRRTTWTSTERAPKKSVFEHERVEQASDTGLLGDQLRIMDRKVQGPLLAAERFDAVAHSLGMTPGGCPHRGPE